MIDSLEIKQFDFCGMRCPMPLLKTRQALRCATKGELLCVRSDDVGAAADLPRWLATSEHTLLQWNCDDDVVSFWIRRG